MSKREESTISKRDLEQLSAYLDGALSDKERAIIEARLKLEPELRGNLHELRLSKEGMKSLPEIRIPRSFLLSPDVVGSRSPSFNFPTLEFATVVTAIAFVALVGLDYISNQTVLPSRVAPAVMQEMQADAVEGEEMTEAMPEERLEKFFADDLEAPAAAQEGELLLEEEAVAEAPPPLHEEAGAGVSEAEEEARASPAEDVLEEILPQPTMIPSENEQLGFAAAPETAIKATLIAQAELDATEPFASRIELFLNLLGQFRFMFRYLEIITAVGLLVLVVVFIRSRRAS